METPEDTTFYQPGVCRPLFLAGDHYLEYFMQEIISILSFVKKNTEHGNILDNLVELCSFLLLVKRYI